MAAWVKAAPTRSSHSHCYMGTMVCVFFAAIALTAGTMFNANGVRAMWRHNGIPCVPGVCPHTAPAAEPAVGDLGSGGADAAAGASPAEADKGVAAANVTSCPVADAQMKAWLKWYQSSEMVFAFLGVMLDVMGPKLSFAFGELLLVGSIALLYFQFNWPAVLISGATTQFILNSSMCIGNLFTDYRNAVMTFLTSGADLSQYLWPIGTAIGAAVPSFDYFAFLITWAAIAVCSTVVGLLLLPNTPFPDRPRQDNDFDGESECLVFDAEGNTVIARPKSWFAAIRAQLSSLPFWGYTFIWSIMIIRLNAYIDSNEDILREYGDDGSMGESFGLILPLSFVPCVLVGMIVDKKGIMQATAIMNVISIVCNVLALLPVLKLQWLTVTIFVISKSGLFSLMYCFVAEVFGFSNFGTLTAVMSLVGGLGNLGLGSVLIHWAEVTESWRWPLIAQLVAGGVCQWAIYALATYLARRKTGAVSARERASAAAGVASRGSRVSVSAYRGLEFDGFRRQLSAAPSV